MNQAFENHIVEIASASGDEAQILPARGGISNNGSRLVHRQDALARFVGPSGRIGRIFRDVRVHVVPRPGTLDEDVRLGAKPARIVEGADSDADQIRAGRDPQKQHAAAFRTKRPGYLITAVCGFDVELRLALGDLEARRRHPHRGCVGAAALALAVAAMAKQRKDRFSRTLVPDGPAEAAARHWARHLPYLSSRLVQPECMFPNNVVDPEIVVWVVTLDVVVP